MWKYIRKAKFYYFLFIIFDLACNIGRSLAILQTTDMLQNALNGNTQLVYKNISFIIGFYLISVILGQIAQTIVFERALRVQNIKLKSQIANKINLLSEEEYSKFKKGELMSWFINDVNTIETDMFAKVFDITSATLTLTVYAFTLYKIGWTIGLVTFAIAILIIIIPFLFVKLIKKSKDEVSKQQSTFTLRIVNLISGYREFSYKNKKSLFNKFVNKEIEDLENAKFKLDKKVAYKSSIVETVSFLGQYTIFIFAIIFYILNLVLVGAIVAIGGMVYTIVENIRAFIEALTTIKTSKIILRKFETKEISEIYEPKEIDFEDLQVKNLNYQINRKKIFKNFNLKIEKNKRHLLVGPSGSGKSTLFKIIFGLINDYEGELIINQNLNYKELNKKDLWNLIAYVPQENIIFNASLRDNLTLWNENINNSKILEVLEKVNLSHLLENMTLDTLLNNDSKNLSGGEIQRVAIARALLQNKSFMIMDEITSSLDQKNRILIEDLIGSLEKTILYISHTTSISSSNFDKVISLVKN